MPVRVRPSALIAPLACDGRHATLRRSKTRFDSWQGHCAPSPRVCRTHGGLRSRKAGFDSRVGDSRAVLFRSLSSECDGRAHDSAKVEDQVQFLARTWPSDRGSKHSRRRSLTARRRSAKPQKRVRLPPAPLSVCPVVPLSWFTRTDRIEHVAVGVGRRELLAPIRRLIKPCPMRVGPTHRRVPQPGAQGTDREPPKLAHVRQPMTEVINPAWEFLARSKRGTRPMPAWLFGGTRQRRIQFCESGWEETKEGAAVWWRSPDDRTWL